MQFEIRRYQAVDGRIPLSQWLNELSSVSAARVQAYIDRMKSGNFGNTKSVGAGVSELKINFGSGYRVYYLRDGDSVVLLLCGGDKSSQQKDIQNAQKFAADYWRRCEKK